MKRPSHNFFLPRRARDERLLAGVCAGIAERANFDVTLIRLAFLILAFAWGVGVLLYGVLWFFMPDHQSGAVRERDWRSAFRYKASDMRSEFLDSARLLRNRWNRTDRVPWPRPLGRRWIAVGLVSLGMLVFLTSLGLFSWITPMRGAGLALIVLGFAALVSMRGNGS